MSWLSESIETAKALTTPEDAPVLPPFEMIDPEAIPPASVILVYGFPGVKPTQRIGVHKYHHPWHPAFHAALLMRDGIVHNVAQFRTDILLIEMFKSTRRVDVLIYTPMSETQRRTIIQAAELDTSIPKFGFQATDYGVTQLLNFGFYFIKDGKSPVCSENVVRLMGKGGIKCSFEGPNATAPWDLQEYAQANKGIVEQRTAWIGSQYFKI